MEQTARDSLAPVLDSVLDTLDIQSRAAEVDGPADKKGGYWSCQRRNPRHQFRCDCTVRFFGAGSRTIVDLRGRTRNISRGGIGLLVRRPFTTEEVIEVELIQPGRAAMFLAGVVRFVRYAGRGFYEVGVALKAAGPEPVFSQNPVVALKTLDWVRNAKFVE